MHGEGGNILERHLGDLAILALGADAHQPRRRFQHELGDRFDHLEHSRFEQGRCHANGVRPGHRRVFRLLHDDEAGGGARIGRRQDDIAISGRIATRFPQHPQTQVVEVPLEILHLLEHRLAGDIQDAADDDAAGFARRVKINGVD